MNRTKRAYWVLGAALLALIAVCVYVFVVSNSKDADKTQTTALLDETDQSPRVQPLPKQTENGKAEASGAPESASQSKDAAEAEGAQASDTETGMGDLDKEAVEYDKKGQVGDPPPGWKDDYAHWDSSIWKDAVQSLEQIGLIQKNMDVVGGYTFQPTEKQAQRMEELEQEAVAAAEKGLVSKDPKDGYVRLDLDEESGTSKAVYAAPDFADRIREIWDEQIAINKAGMVPVPSVHATNAVGWGRPTDKFKILYLRRPSDGSLVRDVKLPSGERKQFVAAPPPDSSQFSQGEIEMMRKGWERFWKKQMGEN